MMQKTKPDYRPAGRAIFFTDAKFDQFSLSNWINYFIADVLEGETYKFYRGSFFHMISWPGHKTPATEISAETFVTEVQALYDQGDIETAVMAINNYTFYRQ